MQIESRYSETLEYMMEGCQIIGRDWQYLYLNDAAIIHSHRSKDELLGHTMMEVYPGIENTEMFKALRECMEKRVHRQMENKFTYPDGTEGWFELRIEPVPEGIFILSLDISKRKKTEEELQQHREHLEYMVERRTMELKEAQEKLIRQEKFALIGKLAGNVSHELRNPLGAITNSIYYLSMKLPGTDEKITKHLTLIQEQSKRATKIINDLLDFARMKPGEPLAVNIHEVLKESFELIQKPENVVICTSFNSNLSEVFCDPRKMQQAFLNFILNAYQAMENGGTLEITTANKGNAIEIEFKDTGVGIPEENLPRLFEPLFSTKVYGVGLGLSIAKEIIENYKGKIHVQSAVDVGSTFTIELPAFIT